MESIPGPQCVAADEQNRSCESHARSVLSWIRSLACFVCYSVMLVLFAVGALCFYVAMWIHLFFVDSERAPRVARLYIHRGAQLLFLILQRIGLMRVKIDGKGWSSEASVVVANHPSMLDAMLLLSLLPNAVCVMKRPLLRLPIIGGFARWARYIPQAEAPELLKSASQALATGASIIVFPEGTRSDLGGMGTFKRGAARLALEANRPVVPVVISMAPVVLGRGWPLERPPATAIKYEAVRLASLGVGCAAARGGSADDLRAASMRLTQHLEDLIGNSLL